MSHKHGRGLRGAPGQVAIPFLACPTSHTHTGDYCGVVYNVVGLFIGVVTVVSFGVGVWCNVLCGLVRCAGLGCAALCCLALWFGLFSKASQEPIGLLLFVVLLCLCILPNANGNPNTHTHTHVIYTHSNVRLPQFTILHHFLPGSKQRENVPF